MNTNLREDPSPEPFRGRVLYIARAPFVSGAERALMTVLRHLDRGRMEPHLVLDQSINQTLSRTIMTKVTTLIVVVALLVLGGPALQGFSEALVIGILAGTYSSIYISASAALDFGLKCDHVFPPVRSREVDSLP